MKKYLILITFLISLPVYSCKENNTLQVQNENGIFIYKSMDQDFAVLRDIRKVLEENYQRICDDLEYKYKYTVAVEIFPDQKTYDENVMDADVAGSPASSGSRRMQLVSPKSPIKVQGIPYKERLMMAVHEFVHLMNDEINDDMPIWLDEGLACYEGSFDIYEKFCRLYFSQLPPVQLKDLRDSYYSIAGVDIYSYSAVHFIVEKYGMKKFNQIIRDPEHLENILSVSMGEFNKEWNSFINVHYKNH